MILVEVDDFTKYALLAIIQYVQWSKIGCVKNAIDLSKYIFSQSNLFMHIINMYVIHLQTTKGYTEVSVRSCCTKFAILALYCRHHTVRITKLNNSCNTDYSVPSLLPNIHCLIMKGW